MQTYGLKIGDRIALADNAGTSDKGFYNPKMGYVEPINTNAWDDDDIFVIEDFLFHEGVTYVKISRSSAFIATEVVKASKIKFGNTEFVIKRGSGKAQTSIGIVTRYDIEELIDRIEHPGIKILGHTAVISLNDKTEVLFGCQSDTYGKIMKIYKEMIGKDE